MYIPLLVYLFFWLRDYFKNDLRNSIPVKYFFLCAIVDVHATMCIIFAYTYTSLTSVVLLEDLTIPAAAFMSIFFLKIKYSKTHFFALAMCFSGMTVSFCNDLFKASDEDAQKGKN